jgi:hypothetical protein
MSFSSASSHRGPINELETEIEHFRNRAFAPKRGSNGFKEIEEKLIAPFVEREGL